MEIADEIEKLQKLKQEGSLTEEEFEKAKQSLLAKRPTTGDKIDKVVSDVSTDPNMWSMFIHLSQFCGIIIPYGGMVVPIVLWQIKKNESEVIDAHGRIVVNWILSALIYSFVSFILFFLIIGFLTLAAVIIMGIVFPIIGGIKANNGQVWPYPLSIKFFKLPENIG